MPDFRIYSLSKVHLQLAEVDHLGVKSDVLLQQALGLQTAIAYVPTPLLSTPVCVALASLPREVFYFLLVRLLRLDSLEAAAVYLFDLGGREHLGLSLHSAAGRSHGPSLLLKVLRLGLVAALVGSAEHQVQGLVGLVALALSV